VSYFIAAGAVFVLSNFEARIVGKIVNAKQSYTTVFILLLLLLLVVVVVEVIVVVSLLSYMPILIHI